MSHLSTDRLAAIADDTPTADEATHLAGCWDCRAEVSAYRRLARMAAMAPIPTEPLTAWSELAPQLRAEGIIVDSMRLDRPVAQQAVQNAAQSAMRGARVVPITERKPTLQVWAMRAAAGLALVFGGAAVGRYTAVAPAPLDPTNVAIGRTAPAFQSADEALNVLTSSQQQYQRAAAFLATQDTTQRFIGMNEDSYTARLAALDEIAAAARSALYRSPQDPMLNQYYLTTLGAREATLRQIGATLPASSRLERY